MHHINRKYIDELRTLPSQHDASLLTILVADIDYVAHKLKSSVLGIKEN